MATIRGASKLSTSLQSSYKVDSLLRAVDEQEAEQALAYEIARAPASAMIVGNTLRFGKGTSVNASSSNPTGFPNQPRTRTAQSRPVSSSNVDRLKKRVDALQVGSLQRQPQSEVARSVSIQEHDGYSYSIHTLESLPISYPKIRSASHPTALELIANSIETLTRASEVQKESNKISDATSKQTMRVVDTGTPRSTSQLYLQHHVGSTTYSVPAIEHTTQRDDRQTISDGHLVAEDRSDEVRADVQDTDAEIRRAFGLQHGKGATQHQVDALVAALASAMVLLKQYES